MRLPRVRLRSGPGLSAPFISPLRLAGSLLSRRPRTLKLGAGGRGGSGVRSPITSSSSGRALGLARVGHHLVMPRAAKEPDRCLSSYLLGWTAGVLGMARAAEPSDGRPHLASHSLPRG